MPHPGAHAPQCGVSPNRTRSMSLWQLAGRLHVYGRMPRPLALPLAVALRAFAWVRRLAEIVFAFSVHGVLLPTVRAIKWAALIHPKSKRPPAPAFGLEAVGAASRPGSNRLLGPGSKGGKAGKLRRSGSGGRSGAGSSWDGGGSSWHGGGSSWDGGDSSGLRPSISGAGRASAGSSFKATAPVLRPSASGAETASAGGSSFKSAASGLHPSASGAGRATPCNRLGASSSNGSSGTGGGSVAQGSRARMCGDGGRPAARDEGKGGDGGGGPGLKAGPGPEV